MKSPCIARIFLFASLSFLPVLLFSQQHVCRDCTNLESLAEQGDTNALQQYIQEMEAVCPDSFYCLGYANTKMSVAHKDAGRLDAAIHFAKKALAWRQNVCLPSAVIKLTHTCNNLGIFYSELPDFEQAEYYYRLAIHYGDTIQNDPILSSAYQDLGNVKMNLGDYDAALGLYQLAYDKAVRLQDTVRRAEVLLGLGNLLWLMEKYREGIDTLESAIRLFQAASQDEEDFSYRIGECRNNLGNIYKEGLMDYPTSATQYRLAIALHNEDQDKALFQNNLGLTYFLLNDLPNAQKNLELGLANARRNHWDFVASLCLNNLGDVFLAQHNFEKALAHYHLAIRESVREFANPDSGANPELATLRRADCKKDYLLIFLADKAKGWLQFYRKTENKDHLRRALDTYRIADEVVQLMRQEQTMQGSKLFWRQKTKALYESALEASFLLGDPEQAFFFMERSKSILLLDALSAISARSLLPPELSSQEIKLNADLMRAKQAHTQALGTPAEMSARQFLLQKQQALDDFIQHLSGTNEAYQQIRLGTALPSPILAREKILRPGEALLHYFLGEKHLFALSIPKSGTPRFLQIPAAQLDGVLRPLLEMLVSPGGEAIRNDYECFVALSHELYQVIFEPLLPAEVSSVLIVPDMQLAFLPFEALVLNPGSESGQIRAKDFVLGKYSVRHAYSVSALEMQQNLRRKSRRMLCLAPGFKDERNGLAELVGSEQALSGLQFRQSSLWSDGKASKSRFLTHAPGFDILYLFTHASAGNPCIELADSTLYLSEMDGASLVADLVVLAACETAYGTVARGEGVMSMSSGFAYSGAASLISSLWAVNEGSTETIFSDFFNRLPAGISKAEALRQAKLAFIESSDDSRKNPYFWAAFVFFGSDNAVELEAKPKWEGWLLPGVGVALGLVVLVWGLKRGVARSGH